MKFLFFILFFSTFVSSQTINQNNKFIEDISRFYSVNGEFKTNYSYTLRPLDIRNFDKIDGIKKILFTDIFSNNNKSIVLKLINPFYNLDYNSHHPYNRNNGTMIPNKGYQHISSFGLFTKIGPLEIEINPEHHYAENKDFEGFWEGHYPLIWAKRYQLWNHADIPERFGEKRHNKLTNGQSTISLNYKNFSLGISSKNLWWGPSIRNSIMLSNQAQGFNHISFNSKSPVRTFFGNIEFQLVSGRLEPSYYKPPNYNKKYAGSYLYFKKINQNGIENDWRYFQGLIFTYSPKFIDGLSLGFIRWVQMYSALVEGKYWWMEGNPSYFPVFSNLFRNNDKFENYEAQTDQAGGVFLRWIWEKSDFEIYAEFYHNDSKNNLRDFLLDTDHSRAVTIGLQKILKKNLMFSWEWTQMEQNASRLIRNSGSWYQHRWIYHGYTNRGEVMGSGIGPGSNSHFFSLQRIKELNSIGIGLEIIDQDNDFYHEAFASANDFRRYWKDFNIHININHTFKNIYLSSNVVYTRSLNYQWELDDFAIPYYHAGKDVNNFHFNLKILYYLNNP